MIEGQQRMPTDASFRISDVPIVKSHLSTRFFDPAAGGAAADPMQTDQNGGCSGDFGAKRKKSSVAMDCEATPTPSTPLPTVQRTANTISNGSSVAGDVGVGVGEERVAEGGLKSRCRRGDSRSLDLALSCLEGSTMRIPLRGKTLPFQVVRKRGRGISSVVFECERERDVGEDESLPRTVAVKVMCGGESGMGACLREVETLAFLKIKREEAGLTRAPFAELASWFYRHSAMGGVDHICLVFLGGGVSLREAMTERSEMRAAPGVKQPSSSWKTEDVVAVARGLLEGIAFFHSVGLVHADIKPENVVLYPATPNPSPASNSGGSGNGRAGSDDCADPTRLPFDLRLIDLGNSVFAADTVPGVTAGTPSYLSPEATKGMPWGPPVDVWAVGCILYEIMTGGRVGNSGNGAAPPQDGSENLASFGSGAARLENGAEEASGKLFPRMMALVKQLLSEDVATRPSAVDALNDYVFSLSNGG
ncbi:unnamed protein product [Ascophyllum nodosum]